MVRSLAEAAGIRRALVEHEDSTWVRYAATDRPKHDMRMGDCWGFPTEPEHCWTMPAGTLCVIVAGQRHPHQHCSGRWQFIDSAQDIERGHYYDHFEAVDERRVVDAWGDDAKLAQAAYESWSRYLEQDEILSPRSRVRLAVENGDYGLGDDDAAWRKKVRSIRETPWKRALAREVSRPAFDDEFVYC